VRARAAHKAHEFIDVIKRPDKLDEMLALSDGERRVPVIVEDGKATVGFHGS
jgi:glutaredoxin 3